MLRRTLNNGIHNPLLLWTGAPFGQVSRHRLIDLDQASFLIHNMKLMLVNQLMIPRTKFTNGLITLVDKRNVSMAVSISSIVVAFKAEQDVLALPTTSLEIGRPDAENGVARPHQVTIVSEDVWPGLARTMLLRRSIREASKWREEEIALLDGICGRNGDVQTRRCEVRTRPKLPVCHDGRQQCCRDEAKRRACFHGGRLGRLLIMSDSWDLISSLKNRYIHLDSVHEP